MLGCADRDGSSRGGTQLSKYVGFNWLFVMGMKKLPIRVLIYVLNGQTLAVQYTINKHNMG